MAVAAAGGSSFGVLVYIRKQRGWGLDVKGSCNLDYCFKLIFLI